MRRSVTVLFAIDDEGGHDVRRALELRTNLGHDEDGGLAEPGDEPPARTNGTPPQGVDQSPGRWLQGMAHEAITAQRGSGTAGQRSRHDARLGYEP